MSIESLLPILIPLVILQVTLMIVALVHLLRHQEEVKGNMIVWLIVIIAVNIIGPILYLTLGRKK